MKKLISAKLAGNILLISFGLLIIFHILVLLGVISSGIVWGGQSSGSPTNMRTLEFISMFISIVFAAVIAAKMYYIKAGKFKGLITVCVWIIFAYMILNTLGNLASFASLEKIVFTPITLLSAFLALRLAIEK